MRALRDVPEALIMMPLSTPWWTMRWIEYDEAAGFRLVVPPIELPEVPAIKPPEFPTIKLPIKLPIEFPTIKPPELPVTNPQQWREAEDELWKLPAIKPPPICHWLCVIGRFLALKRVVAVP